MKVSLSSLNNYLAKKLSAKELEETLLKTEVEVEQIISSNDFDSKIIVGEIIEITKHPDANKLSLAKINIGKPQLAEVVCGDPNIRVGQKVPYAQIGVKMRDGLVIKKTKIRGQSSDGMLCSAEEIGISEDGEKVLSLPEKFIISKPLKNQWPKDIVFDIKTPTNRWDYLSLIGLAREISVFSVKKGNSLKLPKVSDIELSKNEKVQIFDKNLCPRFISARLKVNSSINSPAWLIDFLEKNDLRSFNAIVDVLNFVMLETGQPAHGYDADKIKGNLAIRFAKSKEKLIAIDGSELELDSSDLVVADDKRAVALAGVIGEKNSEISEDTKEIILEVANFAKGSVRKSALRHGKRTEASKRFERGLPLGVQPLAFFRIVDLLKEIVDAEIIDSPIDQLYQWPWVQHIGLRLRKAEKVIGKKIDEKEIVKRLKQLGFEVEHFSLTKESKKYLGKPYKWGANFRQDGTNAFDCSYLTDYIYSLIGVNIGHTAFEQYKKGTEVELSSIKPGDLVFYSGHWDKLSPKDRGDVGHCGIYIGNNKVIAATSYCYQNGKWQKLKNPGVIQVKLADFTKNPGFKGIRRYVDNFNHILAITCPWWRADIKNEEDIIEEVVKIIGYDNLSLTLSDIPPMDTSSHQLLQRILNLKKALTNSGLMEVYTYSLVSADMIKSTALKASDHLKLANPLTSEQAFLRTDLLASFLKVVSANINDTKQCLFFEISKLHLDRKNKKYSKYPVDEPWVIAIASYGQDSLAKVKGVIDYIAKYFNVVFDIDTVGKKTNYIKDRYAQIRFAKQDLGYFGQIDYGLLDKYDINLEVSFAQFDIDSLLCAKGQKNIKEIVPYQLVQRDISILVDEKANWQTIYESIISHKQVSDCNFLGDYVDNNMLKSNKKSVSFRVNLDMGPNPDIKEVDKNISYIIQMLKKLVGFVEPR